MSVSRVLVVDADDTARRTVSALLSQSGCEIVERSDGRSALQIASQERFDLVVLELALPDLDGITLCRGLRSSSGPSRRAAILIVTTRRLEADKVVGFDSGADDYMTKPVDARELSARVAALLRHHSGERAARPARVLTSRDLVLDTEHREVTLRGAGVTLTRQEFDLLALLLSRRGLVFTRDALAARLWDRGQPVTTRSVDAAISRLRRKIERNPRVPELILTAWGTGYTFVDADRG